VDPGVRQRGPDRGLASVWGKAKAVRAVGNECSHVADTSRPVRRQEIADKFCADHHLTVGFLMDRLGSTL